MYIIYYNAADNASTQRILNHPVHIVESSSGLPSPSAFIPFCELAGDPSLLGRRVGGFDVPVCDKFEPTVVEGQICYRLETDRYLKQLRREGGGAGKEREGLTLLLDYNEERSIQQPGDLTQQEEESFMAAIVALQQRHEARVILETISQ